MIYRVIVLLSLAQLASATTPIKRFEDIEIGMPASSVIGELVQRGYAVRTPVEGAPGRIVERNGERVGVFYVDKEGLVTEAAKSIYSAPPSKRGDMIDFAEALFWLIRDEGTPVQSDRKDQRAAATTAILTADEIESRLPGQTFRRIFIHTKSGGNYRISLERNPGGGASEIEIEQITPFPTQPK